MDTVVRIKPQDARPGMTVAEAVYDNAGRLLIPAHFRLTPLQITCLARWGVNAIDVLATDVDAVVVPPPPPEAPGAPVNVPGAVASPAVEFARALDERLAVQFADVMDAPMMSELRRLVRDHLLVRRIPHTGAHPHR